MSELWTNGAYCICGGALIDTGRKCYVIYTMDGESTDKYAFSLKKAIYIAERLTETTLVEEADYDTGGLNDELISLEQRILELENLVSQMETDLSKITEKKLIKLHEGGKTAYQIAQELRMTPDEVKSMIEYLELENYYYIYVIGLDKKVMTFAPMQRDNPNYKPDYACFYVGSTSYYPEDRFETHKKRVHVSVPLVADYGTRIIWSHFEYLNPFQTKRDAEDAEVELAHNLKAKGYGVYYGIGRPHKLK